MRLGFLRITSLLAIFSFSLLALPFEIVAEARPQGGASLQGEARKKEIARKVDLLASMGYGLRVHNRVGANGDAMILDLAMEGAGYSDPEEFIREEGVLRDLQSKDIQFADMTAWGTMKLPAAQDLFASDDDWDEGRVLAARRRGLGQVILKELSEMNGVTFGFTSGSSSYCGISFMGLLIVDEENGLIHEISLTNSGPC
jgi:hypothetical protein